MEWDPKWLREFMWTGEILVWGSHIETQAPGDVYWFDRDIYFTNQRVLYFGSGGPKEIRYSEISKMGKAGPGSGGVKGVKATYGGGGCLLLGSTRGAIDLQFQDSQSLEYGNWLLNEGMRGGELKAAEGVPTIEGTRDPNAPPPPPPEKIGGCFVATAAYGAQDFNVLILQGYRDQILTKSLLGKCFVRLYHLVSPPLARFIDASDRRRSLARTFLSPFIVFARRRLEFLSRRDA